MNDLLSECFTGERLWGDDFTFEQIQEWYVDEKEGYANLGAKDRAAYQYAYHALNKHHAFRYLKGKIFDNALGIGSAYGDELIPIQNAIENLIILDPSDNFYANCNVRGTCSYEKPDISGDLKFDKETFDLIVCLGVMHHIPNVTHVMSECFRCLRPGGIMVLREPIVSMGDWRYQRQGLTKRERGIPLNIFKKIILSCGFNVKHQALCGFTPLIKLASKLGLSGYNSLPVVTTDKVLSKIFSSRVTYHRERVIDKFAPTSLYSVLEKPRSS